MKNHPRTAHEYTNLIIEHSPVIDFGQSYLANLSWKLGSIHMRPLVLDVTGNELLRVSGERLSLF